MWSISHDSSAVRREKTKVVLRTLLMFYFQPIPAELEECASHCPWLLLVILVNRFRLTEVWKLFVFWFSGRFFRSLKISLHSTQTPNDSTPVCSVCRRQCVVRKQSRDIYALVDTAAALFAFNELPLVSASPIPSYGFSRTFQVTAVCIPQNCNFILSFKVSNI
jgi:hypothetical protein